MEGAAAAAAAGVQAEATQPGQPAEAAEHPASPTSGQGQADAGHEAGGAGIAAAGAAARAQGASLSGGAAHKRKPGRPALHQGCQVCGTPLEGMRSFHQRYHICEKHMMADQVEWKGEPQRFCQQCGRFHPLDAFAPGMRSCRKQLAKHAERRRRGRELAAQAAAAAAAAAGGSKPVSPTAPAAKRPRSVALSAPEPSTIGATRLLQPPSTWRIADSTGSGGSSGLHQSVPESGVDALLAAAEEDALAEAEGMDEDAGQLKQESQQDAPPLRLEPDPAWFAGAATVPLPPPQFPAAVAFGSLSPALPGGAPTDATMAAALAALGGGPAALTAVAVAQQARQAQQAQLAALLLAQQQQQQRQQSALAALLNPPAQQDNTALSLALMQQAAGGPPPAPQPPSTLLQQLLGGSLGGGAAAAALLQQAVAQAPVPPPLEDRQTLRERQVAVLYKAAVERLLQTIVQLHPHVLALPGALAHLQAQPAQQPAQQQAPSAQQQPQQPQQEEATQQQQPAQQQHQDSDEKLQQPAVQQPAARSPAPQVLVVTAMPAQPLSPPSQPGQPASQPVSPLAQLPQ
ncbi:squamosa promoter-binding 16 [Chlorella sorokiniana]|uniref:Squamosa promoter-binding 16 n=1 Tax=Chlorella sorokiniana TaxID=3076 RepID=A0A2P6TCY8_CHLSO|nr:squamosa promoter-binding 16 [Chlorella sorokiniana]|eukprot:PRW20503.1 squamosa promoter-binding 16 [Chlorella sorokiniana]